MARGRHVAPLVLSTKHQPAMDADGNPNAEFQAVRARGGSVYYSERARVWRVGIREQVSVSGAECVGRV